MNEGVSSRRDRSARPLCIVGDRRPAHEELARLAGRAGLDVRFSGDAAGAADIVKEPRPAAIVLPHGTPDRPSLVSRLRETLAGEPLPILAWLPSAAPALADEAIWDGVDDYVVDGAAGHMAAILALIQRKDSWDTVRAPVGTAILAHGDRTERIRLGQVMRASGFDLHFAASLGELEGSLARVAHRVVVSTDVFPDGAALGVLAERVGGKATPTVIVAPGDRLEPIAAALGDSPWARLLPAEADPAQITFLVNDLLAPAAAEGRRTPRVLYGTMVSFRYPPAEDRHYGYSYNANLNGLFVRTIAPPPLQSIVECRFRPPCGDGEVVLPAQVVWRKQFAAAGGVLSPAGIGVQLLDGARPADRAGYEAGYEALVAVTKPEDA